MKLLLAILLLLTATLIGCSKRNECRIVTVKIINGCINPTRITTTIDRVEYCGAGLILVRKQAGYYEQPEGSGTCRVTTIVIEQ